MNPEIQKNRQQAVALKKRAKGLRIPFSAKSSAQTERHTEEKEILRCVAEAWREWHEANIGFEYASDEKLVDYFTYKLKACEARYAYFVGLAKEKGINAGVTGAEREFSGKT